MEVHKIVVKLANSTEPGSYATENYSKKKICGAGIMETHMPVWAIIVVGFSWLVLFPLFFLLFATIFRHSGATKAAIALVEATPEASAFLGSPLKAGVFIFGTIHTSLLSITGLFRGRPFETNGYASLWVPLSGPRGQARLRVKLEKIRGVWRVYYGRMTIGGKELILVNRKPERHWFRRIFAG